MPVIEPGQKAPAFSLPDQHGTVRSLADYAGRPVVLYFYPKDDTSGCTKEACTFQDGAADVRHVQGRRARHEHPRQRQQGEVRQEVRPDLPAARRRGSRRRREVRRVAAEEHVRPQVHGHRPHHLPDRPGRHGRAALGQRQAGRASGRGPRRGPNAPSRSAAHDGRQLAARTSRARLAARRESRAARPAATQ